MADVKFEVVRQNLNTTTGTQNFTISGFGTPKAAMFFLSGGSTDDTIAADALSSIGFTDGTRSMAVGVAAADAISPMDASRTHDGTACIVLRNPAHTTTLVNAEWNAWVTDGVQININTAPSTAYLVTCVLIGGTDVSNAYTNYKDDLGTGTAAVDITDPGFEPDVVFFIHDGANSVWTTESNATYGVQTFGCAINDVGVSQASSMIHMQHNTTLSSIGAYISNTYGVGQSGSTLTWGGTVGAFDSSGFSITPSASANSDAIAYLALKFSNSPDFDLFDLSIPTSGNYAETTPGFEPNFGLICTLQELTTRDSASGTVDLGFGVSVFDESNIYTTSYAHPDNVNPAVSKSLSSDQFRILDSAGVLDAAVASSYAFDSDGWDFTLSTNPSTAILGWGLAIGTGSTDTNITAGPTSGTITTYQAQINDDKNITTNTATATVTTYQATVHENSDIDANTASATINTYPAVIGGGGLTTITKTIKPSGGDYSTVAAWLTDNGGAASKDLVTENRKLELVLYPGDYTAVGGGVNIIEEEVSIDGFTTDATHNIVIRTDSTARHDGTPGSGLIWQTTSGGTVPLTIADSYVEVQGIEFRNSGGTIYHGCLKLFATNCGADGCIFYRNNTGGECVYSAHDNTYVRNSLLLGDGPASGTSGVNGKNYIGQFFENCTFAGLDYAVDGVTTVYRSDIIKVRNCVSYNCGQFYNPAVQFFHVDSGYNASSNYTTQAPPDEVGSSNYTSNVVAGDFYDPDNNDFHLSATSNLYDAGIDLSGTFTGDIDGDTRSTWDIGMDEYTGITIIAGPAIGTITPGLAPLDLGDVEFTTTGPTAFSIDSHRATIDWTSTDGSTPQATLTTYPAIINGQAGGDVTVPVATAVATISTHDATITGNTNNDVDVITGVPPVLSINTYSAFINVAGQNINIPNVTWNEPTGWDYVEFDGIVNPGGVNYYLGGEHDGDDQVDTLVDSTATWTVNQWVGYKLVNVTDNSEGVITANGVVSITAYLENGSDNLWDIGDQYQIVQNIDGTDQIVYQTTTTLNGSVTSMTTDGVPTVTGIAGTHAFDVKYRDSSTGQVSSTETITVEVT